MVLEPLTAGRFAPANDNVGPWDGDFILATKEKSMGTAMDRKRTITALNDLLRGELSAVETYDMALPLINDDRMALADLRACRSSHQDRVDLLRDAVIKAGGEPVDSSGAWGAFARAVEGGASALGSSSLAVKTLEKGEEHGLREYEELLPRLEMEWRTMISKEALPEQRRTQNIVSSVQKLMNL